MHVYQLDSLKTQVFKAMIGRSHVMSDIPVEEFDEIYRRIFGEDNGNGVYQAIVVLIANDSLTGFQLDKLIELVEIYQLFSSLKKESRDKI